MKDTLQHYGVLGMRWGRRKSKPLSSDRKKYESIRTKKLSDMTDEEVKFVTKRLRLESDYRNSGFIKQNPVRSLSNEQLDLGTKRNNLKKAYLKDNPANLFSKKLKDVDALDLKTVNRLISRINLEKQLKDLAEKDVTTIQDFIFNVYEGKFVNNRKSKWMKKN